MEDFFRGDEVVLRWWRRLAPQAESVAGLQRVTWEVEESVHHGYLEAAAEPFERQVHLETPLGAVPREYGERCRDGIREDKLKFYRAKVRGQEKVFDDLAIDVWTSPDGAAVVGVRRQEVVAVQPVAAVGAAVQLSASDVAAGQPGALPSQQERVRESPLRGQRKASLQERVRGSPLGGQGGLRSR